MSGKKKTPQKQSRKAKPRIPSPSPGHAHKTAKQEPQEETSETRITTLVGLVEEPKGSNKFQVVEAQIDINSKTLKKLDRVSDVAPKPIAESRFKKSVVQKVFKK